MVDAPKINAFASLTLTLLPLVTTKVAKSFDALVKVISFALPAEKVALLPEPFTTNAPLWVIAPFAFAIKLPLKVTAGKLMPALSKIKVKSRNPLGKLGTAADAKLFR